ncbi:hypothetical protein KFE98_19680 [bacterium SCSIO 12741]|nr:hypothetical protein KFE98_19680 [bacterium SCSIO 12741]
MNFNEVFEKFSEQENFLEPDFHRKSEIMDLVMAEPTTFFRHALFSYSSSSASRFLRSFPSGWNNMSMDNLKNLIVEVNKNDRLDPLYALLRFLHCTLRINGLDYYLQVCSSEKGILFNHVKESYSPLKKNLESNDEIDMRLLQINIDDFYEFREKWEESIPKSLRQ